MAHEEIRKGPWTEQEDLQLVGFVRLFGDRRWDFIAKVSGLNRTGKSCRLRWVNYLQPGLKRRKMTPQEEQLVLELHNKWGNRWSRIARKLPGRTDNEIKNYWRTYTRKKAQTKKRGAASPASSSSTCASSASNIPSADTLPIRDAMGESFYDTGGPGKGCSMEDIWEDIFSSEENSIIPAAGSYPSYDYVYPPIASPTWELGTGNLWKMDEEDGKMFESQSNQFFSSYENCGASFSG
ncbi:hypothetical protein MLD38_003988 [Melastoma candidum]|uniref:Uncharacterized protein n=1 Tax=Melastoma candidum TaxID=119954 RepID=A0ACB9S5M3_9MYRT|nr:hypothetical protein MLD38_003988 [Melastoma candidum]